LDDSDKALTIHCSLSFIGWPIAQPQRNNPANLPSYFLCGIFGLIT
jgi:hypothetical protein